MSDTPGCEVVELKLGHLGPFKEAKLHFNTLIVSFNMRFPVH